MVSKRHIFTFVATFVVALGGAAVAADFSYTVPSAGVTPGPTWASLISTALTTLKSHTHDGSTGEGPQLSTNGLVENATREMNNNPITEIDALVFNDDTGSSSGTYDLYPSGGDLYYAGTRIVTYSDSAVDVSYTKYPTTRRFSMANCAYSGTFGISTGKVEYDDTAGQTWVAVCPLPKPESGSGATIDSVLIYANTSDSNCDIDSGITYSDVMTNSTNPSAAETKTNENFGTAYATISFTADITPGLAGYAYFVLDPGNDGLGNCDDFFFLGYLVTYTTTLYGHPASWAD